MSYSVVLFLPFIVQTRISQFSLRNKVDGILVFLALCIAVTQVVFQSALLLVLLLPL